MEVVAAAAAVGGAIHIIHRAIQIATHVVEHCQYYFKSVVDVPSHLRVVFVEISATKAMFESLKSLVEYNHSSHGFIDKLSGDHGTIMACQKALVELEILLKPAHVSVFSALKSKKAKAAQTLVSLSWPLKENKAKKLLSEIGAYRSTMILALSGDSLQDLKTIKTMLNDSQKQSIYKWLERTDPRPLHHEASKKHHQDTCEWIEKVPQWSEWLKGNIRSLFIHGIPGSGKTVLVSHLVERTKAYCKAQMSCKKLFCLYYYCSYGHKQDEGLPFLQWMINQLCRKSKDIPESLYKLHQLGGQPNIQELLEVLFAILQEFESVYVLIDALDESKPRDDLLEVLGFLLSNDRFSKIQFLTTSREYVEIEKVLLTSSFLLSMKNPYVVNDIRDVVRTALQSGSHFRHWPNDSLSLIEDVLPRKAEGMFRWAVCQLDILRRYKGERHIIIRVLATLPRTLYETYDRLIRMIPENDRVTVNHILQWIRFDQIKGTYLVHGIGLPVLVQALEASLTAESQYGSQLHFDVDAIRELCGCLVQVDQASPSHYIKCAMLTLPHYTVEEYLDTLQAEKTMKDSLDVFKVDMRKEFVRIVVLIAQSKPKDQVGLSIHGANNFSQDLWEGYSNAIKAMSESFFAYALCMAFVCLEELDEWFAFDDDIFMSFLIDLIDPSQPPYRLLTSNTKSFHNWIFKHLGPDRTISLFKFEDFGCNNFSGAHVMKVLSFWWWYNARNDYKIIRKVLGAEPATLLNSCLSFRRTHVGLLSPTEGFDGTVVNVCAQLAGSYAGFQAFMAVIMTGAGHFDASEALQFFIGAHSHDRFCNAAQFCPVQKLLEFGACPDGAGYAISLLQIATYRNDIEGVRQLLEAGANVNTTGNDPGETWQGNTMMESFDKLANFRPLEILTHFDEDRAVEKLLREYGAEEVVPERFTRLG